MEFKHTGPNGTTLRVTEDGKIHLNDVHGSGPTWDCPDGMFAYMMQLASAGDPSEQERKANQAQRDFLAKMLAEVDAKLNPPAQMQSQFHDPTLDA